MQWSQWPRSHSWKIGGGVATLALAGTLLTGTAGTVFAASGTATPSSTGTTTGSSTSTTQTSPSQQFEDQLAKNLGITTDQLKSALQTTEDQTIDNAVASGKLTQSQADRLKQQVASGQDLTLPFLFDGHFPGRHDGVGPESSVIASTLGITEQELQTELSSGSTLQQVITTHGKTVTDVVNAIVAQEKTELDQAVQAGKLTQGQETQRLSTLTQDVTDAINNNTLDFGGHGPGHGVGHGRLGTPQPGGTQTPAQSGSSG